MHAERAEEIMIATILFLAAIILFINQHPGWGGLCLLLAAVLAVNGIL